MPLYCAKINLSYYVNVEGESEEDARDRLLEKNVPELEEWCYCEDSYDIEYIEHEQD